MLRRRVGLFGGTFDPPHRGHLEIVREVLNQDLVDEVIVLPAAIPPHKLKCNVSPATYRLLMTELAFADIDGVQVSDYELQNTEPSYTLYTVDHFRQVLSRSDEELDLYFIVGADSLRDFHLWHQPEKILKRAKLLVLNRPDVEQDLLLEVKKKWNKVREGAVVFCQMEDQPFSSTSLRSRIQEIWQEYGNFPMGALRSLEMEERFQQEFSEAILPKVLRFVLDQGLYGYPDIWSGLQGEENRKLVVLEMKLRKYLRRSRMVHSLNVFLLCLAYAPKFCISPFAASVAGLLHDFAKEFTDDEIMAVLAEDQISYLPKNCPEPILHGPIAAYLMEERFGISDAEIKEAIFYHSTLCADPTDLTKLLFVADKVEPGRYFQDLTMIRQSLLSGDLDEATDRTALAVLSALVRQGLTVDEYLASYLASRKL